MNCVNCSSPIDAYPDAVPGVCAACAAAAIPATAAPHGDGPEAAHSPPTDSPSGVCATCSAPLVAGVIEDVPIAHCPEFHGMMLAADWMPQFVSALRASYAGPDVTPTPLDPAQLAIMRRCPQCGRPMEVHPFYGPGAIVIDSCVRCAVVWLDDGETTRIMRAPGRRTPS